MTSNLQRKPFGTRGKVHEIAPQSAGWRYVGFSLYRLKAGDTAGEATGDREVIMVMVEGKAALSGAGRDWGVLGERMSVFEKSPPHCLYLPNGTDWTARAETDCVIAVCSAPGRSGGSVANLAMRQISTYSGIPVHASASLRWFSSMVIASARAQGPMPKVRSTIRASPRTSFEKLKMPAWPLRRARMTSKPLIVA